MTFPDTGLDVTLRVLEGRVARVDIRSGRLVQAAAMLAGRTPERGCFLLPALFALCGTAQGVAGAAAMEAASGCPVSPMQQKARRWLVAMETLAETLVTLYRDWPALAGHGPELETARTFRPLIAASRKTLYPDGDWPRPGGGRLLPDAAAIRNLMATVQAGTAAALEGFADLDDGAAINAWARKGKGPAARLCRTILAEGWSEFGHTATAPMPEGGPPDLDTHLDADRDGRYLALPHWRGAPLDASALSRHNRHALVAGLGSGLLARFAARLRALAESLREAEDLVQDLAEDSGLDILPMRTTSGLSRVEAARGLLVHRVELEEGVIRRYQILAPTEWTFHPEGALAGGLLESPADAGLERRARILAALLDPCVELRLKVEAHA